MHISQTSGRRYFFAESTGQSTYQFPSSPPGTHGTPHRTRATGVARWAEAAEVRKSPLQQTKRVQRLAAEAAQAAAAQEHGGGGDLQARREEMHARVIAALPTGDSDSEEHESVGADSGTAADSTTAMAERQQQPGGSGESWEETTSVDMGALVKLQQNLLTEIDSNPDDLSLLQQLASVDRKIHLAVAAGRSPPPAAARVTKTATNPTPEVQQMHGRRASSPSTVTSKTSVAAHSSSRLGMLLRPKGKVKERTRREVAAAAAASLTFQPQTGPTPEHRNSFSTTNNKGTQNRSAAASSSRGAGAVTKTFLAGFEGSVVEGEDTDHDNLQQRQRQVEGAKPIHERMLQDGRRRAREKRLAEEEKARDELAACTFKPQIGPAPIANLSAPPRLAGSDGSAERDDTHFADVKSGIGTEISAGQVETPSRRSRFLTSSRSRSPRPGSYGGERNVVERAVAWQARKEERLEWLRERDKIKKAGSISVHESWPSRTHASVRPYLGNLRCG